VKRDIALERYFAEAASWDKDRDALLVKSERRAWRVAAISWFLLALAIGALVGLMPLKTVKPFVVRVDNTTGVVDVVPGYEVKGTEQELVSRYFLTHYVTLRERYFFAFAESDYQEIGAFQSPRLNQDWIELWKVSNTDSPMSLYKDGTTVRVQVKSVSLFERTSELNDIAQVRFTRFVRAGGSGSEQVSHWISTIQYTYVKPSEDPKDRARNPLGFRVIDYHREPEVVVDPVGSQVEKQ
jgi:type IV secretion system protein VirB8